MVVVLVGIANLGRLKEVLRRRGILCLLGILSMNTRLTKGTIRQEASEDGSISTTSPQEIPSGQHTATDRTLI